MRRAPLLIVSMVLFSLLGCAGTQESAMTPESQQPAMAKEEMAKPPITKSNEQGLVQRTDNGLFAIEMVIPAKKLRIPLKCWKQ